MGVIGEPDLDHVGGSLGGPLAHIHSHVHGSEEAFPPTDDVPFQLVGEVAEESFLAFSR